MKVLYERAVAYLNVDYAVDYNYVLFAGTSPLLQDSLYQATKLVRRPFSNLQLLSSLLWISNLPIRFLFRDLK